jgi:hypothetical protein
MSRRKAGRRDLLQENSLNDFKRAISARRIYDLTALPLAPAPSNHGGPLGLVGLVEFFALARRSSGVVVLEMCEGGYDMGLLNCGI